MKSLCHPNIVNLYEVIDGFFFHYNYLYNNNKDPE